MTDDLIPTPDEGRMAPVVLIEFMKLIDDLGGAHYFATLGFWERRHTLMAQAAQAPGDDETRRVWIYSGEPDDSVGKPYLSWLVTDLINEKLGRDGTFSTQLSNAWITGLFSAWESRFRAAITKLLKLSSAVECDEMGDLRRMRNDILHGRGIASREHTGQCVSLRWFDIGDPIRVTSDHIYEFHKKIGPKIADWVRLAIELEWKAIGVRPEDIPRLPPLDA
jgi:hypothetical protein